MAQISTGRAATLVIGGRSFDLPHLPWRVAREIEPALYGVIQEFTSPDNTKGFGELLLSMPREQLDGIVDAVFVAAQFSDKELTRETFDDLPFGRTDIARCIQPLCEALGFEQAQGQAGGDASPPGEPVQTGTG